MRPTTIIFGGLALALCATGGHAQDNTPTQNPPTVPATDTAGHPGAGMANTGGGLSQNMTAREATMAFKHMDANNDGVVSRDEFMAAGDSGQRFPGCDVNNDGKLTQDEYVQCALRPATESDSGGH